MSIVSVEEQLDTSGGYDDQYQREYSRVFEVITDSENDGPITVEFAAGVPRVWDIYLGRNGETDALSVCRKVTPRRSTDDPCLWLVTCEYSTATRTGIGAQGSAANRQPGGDGDDPTKWTPKYSWGSEQVRLPFRKSLAIPAVPAGPGGVPPAVPAVPSKWVLNSAGDPFDPLPEIEVALPTLTVERYQSTFNAGLAFQYAYAVNSDTFLAADPGQAQLMPISAESEAVSSVLLWRVRFTVRFMTAFPYTWQAKLLDAGYRHHNLITGEPDAIRDKKTQQPVSRPVPLDGAGQELSRAVLLGSGPTDGPKYLDFNAYPRVKFADLNLI